MSTTAGASTPGPAAPSPQAGILGEKTPGPPSAGTGPSASQGMNLLAAVAGLIAGSAGFAAVATARRR